MFRRLVSSLPADFTYPHNLGELGYFVNDQDQIRTITAPDRPFHYHISKNERAVQMQKEAMDACIRSLITERLEARGLQRLNLPAGTPDDQPHVPIYTTPALDKCSHVVLYIGESQKDLGVLAGRVVSHETVNQGSVLDFVDGITQSRPLQQARTGLVLANSGQLVWHRRGARAMTYWSFQAIPRATAVAAPYAFSSNNLIPRNESADEHIACVLEDVLHPVLDANPTCQVYFVAAGDAWMRTLAYLQDHWERWKGNAAAFVLTHGSWVPHLEFENEEFGRWWGRRARAYVVSDEPVSAPLQGRSRLGCNVYSGGDGRYVECVMVRAQQHVLDYLKVVMMHEDYANEPQDLGDPEENEQVGGVPESAGWGTKEGGEEGWGLDEDGEGQGEGEGKGKEVDDGDTEKDAISGGIDSVLIDD